jgi:hypothetical protein
MSVGAYSRDRKGKFFSKEKSFFSATLHPRPGLKTGLLAQSAKKGLY